MNFEFPVKITKDLILSKYSEEQIMEFYLHVPVKKGLFRSPLRADKHNTCSYYRSKGKLYFKDFATGEHLNCFSVVQAKFGVDYFTALKIIANDFGIVKNDSLNKNAGKINPNPIKLEDKEIKKIQIEAQPFSEYDLKWWEKYGITQEILDKYEIYSCKHVFLDDSLIAASKTNFPIYGYFGGHIKESGEKFELWRIYFPKRKEYRFIANWPSKKIQGYKQLPKEGKLCIITKSMKDVMTLNSLGIPAIAPCSENLFVPDQILEDLKSRFTYIVVLYDNDLPGIRNMQKFRKEHPELIYTWLPRNRAKDISDYYKEYGVKKTRQLIANYIKRFKNE